MTFDNLGLGFKKRDLRYKILMRIFNRINTLCNHIFLKLIEYE